MGGVVHLKAHVNIGSQELAAAKGLSSTHLLCLVSVGKSAHAHTDTHISFTDIYHSPHTQSV